MTQQSNHCEERGNTTPACAKSRIGGTEAGRAGVAIS